MYTHSQLTNMAVAMHKTGVTHPSQVPAESKQIVAAVLASPQHASIASSGIAGGGVQGSDPNSGTAGAGTANANLGYGPAHMRRTPNTRHQLLGFASVSLPTAVATTVSATPYRNFRVSRSIVSPWTIQNASASGISTASLSTWQVGSSPQFANLNAESIGIYAAGLNGGFQDFDEAASAIAISAVAISTVTATFYGALVGSTRRQKDNNRPASTKVQRLPITSTVANIAAAQSSVTVTPTMPFWGRQILLDETTALGQLGMSTAGSSGAASFNVNGLFVGSDPQFMNSPGATNPVPGSTFNGNYDLFLDFDMADTAVFYTFQIQNIGSATAFFGGVILGDVDKRRLSSFGDNAG